MTKNKLWSIYVKKNPSFEGDGTVTMTCKGLRKFFDTTWDTAYYSQCLPPEAYMRLWNVSAETQQTQQRHNRWRQHPLQRAHRGGHKMKTTELKTLARRFSQTDWQDICASPRSFEFSKMNPQEAQAICQSILIERDRLLQPVTQKEDAKRLAIIAATFGPAQP